MQIQNPHRFSRRAFLAAAPLVPLALAGCGGDSRPEDALPEGYGEAYSLAANPNGDTLAPTWRSVAVTTGGDVLLSQLRRQDEGVYTTPPFDLSLVRYTNEARPGATTRSEAIVPRTVYGETYIAVIPTPDGGFCVPQWAVLSPDEPIAFSGYALRTAEGAPVRRITLAETHGAAGDFAPFSPRTLSIAPNGDFYAVSNLVRDADSYSDIVLRWNASGDFLGDQVVANRFYFHDTPVLFAPNGEPFVVAHNETRTREGIFYLSSGAFVPFATSDGVGRDLQTDAAGNVYFLSPERAGRAITTRNQPAPRTLHIHKFSLTGAELAAFAVNDDFDYGLTAFAVGGDGTVLVVDGASLRVFRRTR